MIMQKIREKSKYALWPIVIAIPIAFFGLSGDTLQQITNLVSGAFSSEDTIDTDIYIGKIENQDISIQQFSRMLGSSQGSVPGEYPSFLSSYVNNNFGGSTTADSFRPWSVLDDIWNLYIEKSIFENEINNLNLSTSKDEIDQYLKKHTPESFKTILMNNGLYNIYNDGIWEEGEEFTDCDTELTICSTDENWEESMGNNEYDTGEPFTDKKEFDVNSFKASFKGLDSFNQENLLEALIIYNSHLSANNGGFGTDFSTSFGFRNPINYPNLSREKINFLYNQLYYISNHNITEKMKNDVDNYTIKLLIGDYTNLDDSLVVVTNDEMKNYYDKNKEEKYKELENISIEYVEFENLTLDFDEIDELNTEQIELSESFANIAKTEGFDTALKNIQYSIMVIENSTSTDTLSFINNNYKPYYSTFSQSLITKGSSDSSAYIMRKPLETKTANIYETLETIEYNLSGFPQEWGQYGRNIASFYNELNPNGGNQNIIRFLFDNAELGKMKSTDSFTLASSNNNVIANMLRINEASYKGFDEVEAEIKLQLISDKKKELVTKEIESLLLEKESLANIELKNDYIQIYDELNSSTLSLNFFTTTSDEYNIGQNSHIAGCLSVMDEGMISYIIDSKNANGTPQLYVVELIKKVEKYDQENLDNEEKIASIKEDLKLKRNNIYNSWLSFSKENISVIDKRQKVF